jgi:hypothetical protein
MGFLKTNGTNGSEQSKTKSNCLKFLKLWTFIQAILRKMITTESRFGFEETPPSDTYKVCFYHPNGKLDGHFKSIHKSQIHLVLQTLPKRWVAVAYGEDGLPHFSTTI